jgi:hypothetical protein
MEETSPLWRHRHAEQMNVAAQVKFLSPNVTSSKQSFIGPIEAGRS